MKTKIFLGVGAMAWAGLLAGADEETGSGIELEVTPKTKTIIVDPKASENQLPLEIKYRLINRGTEAATVYTGPGALILERGHEPRMLRPDPLRRRRPDSDSQVTLAPGESVEGVSRFQLEHEIRKKTKARHVVITNHGDWKTWLGPGTSRKFVFRHANPLRSENWWKNLVISKPIQLSLKSRDEQDLESPIDLSVEDKANPKISFTLAPADIDVAVPPRSARKQVSRLPPDKKVVALEYTITNPGKKPIIVNRGYESTSPILIGPAGELVSEGVGADHYRRPRPDDFATLEPGQSQTETVTISFFRSRETPGIFFSHENRSGFFWGSRQALSPGRYHLAFWYSPPASHEKWELHEAKKPPPTDWWKGVGISNFIELNLSLADAEDES